MKILVPIDFSDYSINAFEYAIEMAKDFKAEIILFHGSHNIQVVDVNVMITIDDLLLKESNDKLNALIKSKESSNINISAISKVGLANDLIYEISKENNIDLIIMGTKGATGLQKIFLGSITSSVIRKSKTSVLAIPSKTKYESLKNISIALDLKDNYTESISFAKQIALKRQAGIDILHIKKSKDKEEIKDESILSLEEKLDNINHSYVFLENNKTTNAILAHIKQQSTDLLVVISKTHSFMERLFNKSVSESIAMNASIPLLVMRG
jgi:nucleotide-binding universal stress UspA family protein